MNAIVESEKTSALDEKISNLRAGLIILGLFVLFLFCFITTSLFVFVLLSL